MTYTWKEYLENKYPDPTKRANVKTLELQEVHDDKVDLSDFTGLESFKLVMIPNTNTMYANRVSEVDISKCVNLKELELVNNVSNATGTNIDISQFANLTNLKVLRLNGLPKREVHNSFIIYSEMSKWTGSLQSLQTLTELEELDISNTNVGIDIEYLTSHKLKIFVSDTLKAELLPFDYDLYAWKLVNRPTLMADDSSVWTNKINNLLKYSEALLKKINEDWQKSKYPYEFYWNPDTKSFINKPKRIVRIENKIALLKDALVKGFPATPPSSLGASGTPEKEADKEPAWIKDEVK